MKRIYFWLKIAVWVLIFAVVFIVFYVNRDSQVSFNYLIGDATLNTSLFICVIFMIGALFTIGVLALLNISRVFSNMGLKNSVKRLEKENAELKRKTHVL
ncbi:lipopolysaccharide assembly protein LapA domain-containing protein [Ignatzschineria rhizosphaerae]|uniref:Lipopolysaccharide assembly protein LapA domain-containing protein n=1 Tax=Ignatzschineria rhizosphaerae TaxID=2923279 RepID=A0ABY3X8H0_9GAMM|nr:lipopolysaccharide assembly protein LapA domain-containing protein [Ignatzschineria rhizosphaerae]UNM97357.1 lipopolysaccharide assembly protein LapA domain-containing protein [Ignatzschineria rhizosphaerae]